MKIYQTIIIALGALFILGCGGATVEKTSPTETLKTFVKASREKDVEAVKKTLSKGSLESFEKSASRYGITLDELLKKNESSLFNENPATRNERVEGDTATLEVENNIGGYDTIPFVKEDGVWKIAFDKNPPAAKK